MFKPDNTRERFSQILSEAEEQSLGRFWGDEVTREAVRKVLLFTIYSHGIFEKGKPVFEPTKNFMLSFAGNSSIAVEEKGKMLEAMVAAMQALSDGFDKLQEYKPVKLNDLEESNPAN